MFALVKLRSAPLISATSVRITVFASSKANDKVLKKATLPDTIENDWIGPPDPESNLRLIKFCKRKDETPAETNYRHMREDLQNWNHAFWTKHNKNFLQQKETFMKESLQNVNFEKSGSDEILNAAIANQMPDFYRKFLDENYQLHRDYNREWYRRNIRLLWPALKVFTQRLFKPQRSKCIS